MKRLLLPAFLGTAVLAALAIFLGRPLLPPHRAASPHSTPMAARGDEVAPPAVAATAAATGHALPGQVASTAPKPAVTAQDTIAFRSSKPSGTRSDPSDADSIPAPATAQVLPGNAITSLTLPPSPAAGAQSAAPSTAADAPATSREDPYTPPTNIAYEIEAGMRAPVALLPHSQPMSPQVAGALESIRQDFDREISAAPDPAAVWEAARKRADDQYRMMFGDEAFNRLSLEDAIQALDSKKAQP